VRLVKRFYGWPEDAKFLVPDGVREHFAAGVGAHGAESRAVDGPPRRLPRQVPGLATEIEQMQRRELPAGWDRNLPVFPADAKGIAGRDASGKVLNVLAQNIPWFLGGSADLGPSNKTTLTMRVRATSNPIRRREDVALRHPRARDGRDRERPRARSSGRSAPRSSSSATTRGPPSGSRP
jgi:transketolase